MAKKPTKPAKGQKPKQKRSRIAKIVARTEDHPPPPPPGLSFKPEPDEDPWNRHGLTLKQQLFCEAYVGPAAGNATKAAELAGYRDDNRVALAVTASENLRKPYVQREISRLLAKRCGGPSWTKNQIADIARSSMADFVAVDDAGNVKIDLRIAQRAAALGHIKKIKVKPTDMGQEITLETYDKTRALTLLADMQGLLKSEPAADGDKEIRVRAVVRIPTPDADPGSES